MQYYLRAILPIHLMHIFPQFVAKVHRYKNEIKNQNLVENWLCKRYFRIKISSYLFLKLIGKLLLIINR